MSPSAVDATAAVCSSPSPHLRFSATSPLLASSPDPRLLRESPLPACPSTSGRPCSAPPTATMSGAPPAWLPPTRRRLHPVGAPPARILRPLAPRAHPGPAAPYTPAQPPLQLHVGASLSRVMTDELIYVAIDSWCGPRNPRWIGAYHRQQRTFWRSSIRTSSV